MKFDQTTIQGIAESERQMIEHGAELYGEYFTHAAEFNDLLNNFIKSIDAPEKFIFVAFLFQVQKYHTLAFFSATRRHHIQASMNLRYVIEAGQWAAYALGNPEEDKFCSKDHKDIIFVDDKHRKAMYKWLDDNFKTKSDESKRLKKMISGAGAHSNIAYAFQNFEMKPIEDAGFRSTFFDPENQYWIRTDLWFVANTAMGLVDLFWNVNNKFHTFQLVDDFDARFRKLCADNSRLKIEMMQTENYKRAQALAGK